MRVIYKPKFSEHTADFWHWYIQKQDDLEPAAVDLGKFWAKRYAEPENILIAKAAIALFTVTRTSHDVIETDHGTIMLELLA